MSIIDLGKSAFPGAPAAGFSRLYVDTGGSLHVILDNGTDIQLGVSVNNGSGAPIDAKYLVLGLSDGLTNERVFSAGQGIEFSDGGPGGLFTMSLGAHKLKHASGGSDPLTPSDIGSAPAVHTHDDRYYTETELATAGQAVVDWENVANSPAIGSGDMEKAAYDPDNDGKVEAADAADTVPWTGVQNPPATYPPEEHTHPGADVTSSVPNADSVPWTGVSSKPAAYPPETHQHAGADITSAVANANAVPWSGVQNPPATYPPDAHDHDDRYYTEGELNTSGAGGAVHWDNITNKPDAGTGDMTKNIYDPDLDGKVESADAADSVPWSGITGKPASALNIILGDGLSEIVTGVKGVVEIPYACQITAVRLAGDAVGSIVVDIWKDVFANFPPTATIVASAKPTLASVQASEDTTLTGWTTSVAAGDWLAFNVESASTLKQVTLSLTLVRA